MATISSRIEPILPQSPGQRPIPYVAPPPDSSRIHINVVAQCFRLDPASKIALKQGKELRGKRLGPRSQTLHLCVFPAHNNI